MKKKDVSHCTVRYDTGYDSGNETFKIFANQEIWYKFRYLMGFCSVKEKEEDDIPLW